MILIVAAMQSEIDKIDQHKHPQVDILQTGVGKVNAAFQLSKVLAKKSYDAIINLGLAGATKPFKPGDVVNIERATYHDFDLTMFGYKIGQVPGCPEHFLPDKQLFDAANRSIEHIQKGFLYTGDRFMTGKMEDSMVFDMEGTALFQVANFYQIPMISIKVISDLVGDHDHIENYKRFESEDGSHKLYQVYLSLLKGVIK
ncbi:MAG: 5'-methylthioadenosine/S-adenosylhomocysteine nucleosidase [Bacillota bacterium]|nr:MAG: 5'-methylthioadenosine/S-adenosylhomocysteine nucleosidase [Bacillota bacterium]